MLTSIDVHYLVGLLTKVSSSSDNEIELGSMVFDASAQEERDIDITVIQKNSDGSVAVFKGIEVKKHTKPLNIIHVEQLCAKFADMPEITHKAIVSASGYTKNAIKKAAHHGVQLYEIKNWTEPIVSCGNIHFLQEGGFPYTESTFDWLSIPKVNIGLKGESLKALSAEEYGALPVYDEKGEAYQGVPDVTTLANYLKADVIHTVTKERAKQGNSKGEILEVNIGYQPVLINPFVIIEDKKLPILGAHVSGLIQKFSIEHLLQFKGLVKVDEDAPVAFFAVVEVKMGNILGVSVNNNNGRFDVLNIPIADRTRNRIFKQKIN